MIGRLGRHHFFTEGIWCDGVPWSGTSGSSSRSGAVDEWRFEAWKVPYSLRSQ